MDEMRALKAIYVYSNHNLSVSTYNRQATIGRQCVQRLQSRWRAAAGRGREARANPRGNLIFKDVTSDGDDCDSDVDEGEQDEEGKDTSG